MTVVESQAEDSAREQALAWYVELQDDELSAEERAAFHAWLAADPAHEREYRQLDALWQSLDDAADTPQAAQAEQYAAYYEAEADRRRRPRMAFGIPRPSGAGAWSALAAAGLVVALTGWLAVASGLFAPDVQHHATLLGEQRTIELADGSTVRLNTQSAIDVAYSDAERRVRLLDGQASFDVAKDAGRPFVVGVGDGEVVAIGTAFDVYKAGQQVTVTLLEGIVQVRRSDTVAAIQPASEPAVLPADGAAVVDQTAPAEPVAKPTVVAELRPGEQVSIGQGGTLTAVARVDVDRVTAWRDGKIDLHYTPLASAIAEVNRYSKVKLVLTDDRLAQVEVSGIFKAGNPNSFVRALEVRFGLYAVRTDDDRILLKSPARG